MNNIFIFPFPYRKPEDQNIKLNVLALFQIGAKLVALKDE
jgi:hypothetical protein